MISARPAVDPTDVWAIVPAAGLGSRMGIDRPKQYIQLLNKPILGWVLQALLAEPRIRGIALVVSAQDEQAVSLPELAHPAIERVIGGAERQDSVLCGLDALAKRAQSNDWVLVHDAARPCLHPEDLSRLIECTHNPAFSGGILATPVADTLKRADSRRQVVQTVSRSGLWRALTPQIFRLDHLRAALTSAARERVPVTDEAQAMERAGHAVRLVPGRADNLKITYPEDLALAEAVLSVRHDPHAGDPAERK